MSGKLLREAEQTVQKRKVLTFGETPLSKTEPLPISEPVRNNTPVEIRTPSEKERGTPSVLPQPLLQTEPVSKSEPLAKSEGVKILSDDAPHLRLPYAVLEHSFRKLKPAPRVILEELYRAAAGWYSDECVISIATLSKHCQIVPTQVRLYLKRLEEEGFIQRLDDVLGGSELMARGVRFRVQLPRFTPTKNRTPSENQPPRKIEGNKERKDLKKDSKREEAPPNFQNCPDCHGTGFHYVDELERGKGVEKCLHDKLKGSD